MVKFELNVRHCIPFESAAAIPQRSRLNVRGSATIQRRSSPYAIGTAVTNGGGYPRSMARADELVPEIGTLMVPTPTGPL
ncbi:MAG: hypothetical protein ACJASD_002339 [Sphingomonas echinoides]|jgi:hypothetical protein